MFNRILPNGVYFCIFTILRHKFNNYVPWSYVEDCLCVHWYDMILEAAFILVRVTAIGGIADHDCSRAGMMFWMPIFLSAAGNLDLYFCTSDYTWRKDFYLVILYPMKLYCVTCHEHLFSIHNQWITSIKGYIWRAIIHRSMPIH